MSVKVDTLPKMGGRMEGRMGGRTKKARKMNNWAKAAGEYYNDHKNEVESFSDVLKSPKFRAYYNKKYKGKKVGGLDGDDTTSDTTSDTIIASVMNEDNNKKDKEGSTPIGSTNIIDRDPPNLDGDQESQQHLKEEASGEASGELEEQAPPNNLFNPTGSKQPGGKKKAKKSKKRSTKKSRKSKKRFFGIM